MTTVDLAELLALQPAGEIRWGLRRTRLLLHHVGRPHMAYPSVHVGGTNGKGSVAAMVASILEASGHRVGLYTSPHLVDFGERIRVAGQPVDDDVLAAAARRLLPAAAELEATFFETTTALAFLCFAEAEVDVVVAEVGLGGRLDATNVLLPEVAAITNLAWDHSDYLGHSMAAIAREKAGICKPGSPLVLGRLAPETGRIVRRAAQLAGAPTLQMGYDAAVSKIRIGRAYTELQYVGPGSGRPITLRCPLLGGHQAWNAGLAALVAESLPDALKPAARHIETGIAGVHWPARLQIEPRGDRIWVLDVAHNPVAVDALAQALASLDLPTPLALVVAIMGDKPWAEMLPPLLALSDASIFTVAPSSPPERRWDPAAAAAAVSGYPIEVVKDFSTALAVAEARAATVVVTGSHHTVGDAMRYLNMPVGLPYSGPVG